MLGQRIVTAIVLLALLTPTLLSASTWPFAVLTLTFIGAAAWEWGRLNGFRGWVPFGLSGVLLLIASGSWFLGDREVGLKTIAGVVAALWVVGGCLALAAGVEAWRRVSKSAKAAVGVLLLWAAWWALCQARALGLSFLLSVFLTVWVADIAAYAGGRMLGGAKLAPRISPGKTWSGALTGGVAVLALSGGWLTAESVYPWLEGNLFSALNDRYGWGLGLLFLIGLVAMSVVGDLFESMVKRSAGVKDSSGLLPGHGGVLDRIDALLPVLPIAVALVSR